MTTESPGLPAHSRVVPAGDYGFIALVTDTEGNMFGLHSLR